MKRILGTLCLLALTLALTSGAALTPANLRCEYAVNPLGVDVANPRLFWTVESAARGQRQTAYQILVATSPRELAADHGDLWDSRKVSSDETIQIPYGGADLKSLQQFFWKVRAWDAKGETSAWSQPANWTMGLLHPREWHAKWIGAADTNLPSILLRRQFSVKPGLKRAVAVVCGLGQYEMSLNGKKVGDDFLSSGWSEYDKTCLYDVRDITADLKRGENAVGFELGNGMYNVISEPGRFTKFKRTFGPQKLIAQIHIEYADGSMEIIGTDENWRVAAGSITYSSIYGGEDCDARLAQRGWNEPGFNDSKWATPKILTDAGAELRGLSCAAPPIRVIEVHKPVASRTVTNGDIVFDFGQNAAHVPRIVVSGPAGGKVRLMPSELVDDTGAANQGSMGGGHRGYIWCDFTKGTNGTETWSPKFFYVGCRYIQAHLTAAPNGALPKITSIEAEVIQSTSQPVGEFECSNPLFNRTGWKLVPETKPAKS